MDASRIVARIRALGGMTRKELAELADLSPSTIGRIEQGSLDPTWGVLSRILESAGFRIHADSVVSAGDPWAVAAARPFLERSLGRFASTADPSPRPVVPGKRSREWITRWERAGWVTESPSARTSLMLAVAAGNASKIGRRAGQRRNVQMGDGWQALARSLERAGIEYAVSGMTAVREDRGAASAMNPLFYVVDPATAVDRLGLAEAPAGRGALFLSPSADEFVGVEVDDGLRFTTRAQAVLDAFAGPGREPDKAEDLLLDMLAASA